MGGSEQQEYLEAFARAQEQGHFRLTSEEIASFLESNIPLRASLLEQLVRKEWLWLDGAQYSLTEKGKAEASRVLGRHRLWERLLLGLGMGAERAHQTACQLEHTEDPHLESQLEEQLVCNQELVDEHGEHLISLTCLGEGVLGTIAALMGPPELQTRLRDMGLVFGTLVEVQRRVPFGPLQISVRGTTLAIGPEISRGIFVRPMSISPHNDTRNTQE